MPASSNRGGEPESSDRGDAALPGAADPPTAVTTLELGDAVACSNGALGVLSDIVLEPIARQVTHLVVRPGEPLALARLVPYELVHPDESSGGLMLRCTVDEAHRLESVQAIADTAVNQEPVEDADWEVGVQDVQPMPHYDAGAFVDYGPSAELEVVRVYDRIPKGHVELRHESTVTTSDGHWAGTLDGMLVEGQQLTQLILGRGHLWRRRQVVVSLDQITSIATDDIVIQPSKSELGKLPTRVESG
jgi:sporulation protein YlmC with PRC-barrel domain